MYRLSLAEYLHTAIVLDDQLVQDDNRMDWFRALLTENARSFQIVVFTSRPGDYLLASALVPQGAQFMRIRMTGSYERSIWGGRSADDITLCSRRGWCCGRQRVLAMGARTLC